MRYYPLIFSTIFFLAFFSQAASGDEQTVSSSVSSSARTVYYSPINAGVLQQSGEPYRAQPMFSSDNSVDNYLSKSLPGDPVAPPTSPDVKRQLKEIVETSRRESSTSGNTPGEQSDPTSPGNVENPPSVPPSTLPSQGGVAKARTIAKVGNDAVAILVDGSTTRVTQTSDGYYDEQNRKIVLVEGGEEEVTTTSGADITPINQIFLIILAFGSTFAAIFIGFIAWDNQRRLEEAIVSQNQRFTGHGSDAFSQDFNSMEPETFSFSTDSFSSNSLDSFDSGTSFRTIA